VHGRRRRGRAGPARRRPRRRRAGGRRRAPVAGQPIRGVAVEEDGPERGRQGARPVLTVWKWKKSINTYISITIKIKLFII
jgi:hypothetical protein